LAGDLTGTFVRPGLEGDALAAAGDARLADFEPIGRSAFADCSLTLLDESDLAAGERAGDSVRCFLADGALGTRTASWAAQQVGEKALTREITLQFQDRSLQFLHSLLFLYRAR